MTFCQNTMTYQLTQTGLKYIGYELDIDSQ